MGVYLISARRIQADAYPWGASLPAAQTDWSTASVGDYADNWSFPHAGQAGYKGPDDVLVAGEDLGSYALLSLSSATVPGSDSTTSGWANTGAQVTYEGTYPGRVVAVMEVKQLGIQYYLPAPDELNGIRTYAAEMGITDAKYLSSRSFSNMSYSVHMGTGTIAGEVPNTAFLVRAFRKPDE